MNMKLFTSLLLIALVFSSCGKDEETININFKLTYDDNPLVMFDEYDYPTGEKFNITRFSFYLSNLEFASTNEAVTVIDAEYIDLTMSNIDTEASENGYDLSIDISEMPDYDRISFGIGLDAATNSTVPADYSSSNDLSLISEYWASWTSYIFVKIEGNIDLDRDGSLEQGVALHLGANEAYRLLNYSNIVSGQDIEITIDLLDIFSDGEVFDLANNPRIHNLNQMPLITQLMDNFAANVAVK